MRVVKIDGARIHDWESFHTLFAESLDFPDYYGRNMNAWIDCMTDLTELVTLHVEHWKDFSRRCPEQYAALVECTAFVNWRQINGGLPPLIALAWYE